MDYEINCQHKFCQIRNDNILSIDYICAICGYKFSAPDFAFTGLDKPLDIEPISESEKVLLETERLINKLQQPYVSYNRKFRD